MSDVLTSKLQLDLVFRDCQNTVNHPASFALESGQLHH